MTQIFQLISSLASIGSIPLAIYLYLRSRDNKLYTIKNDIIKTVLYQIGENRKLEKFEINSIIKSKLRNVKLKETSIQINEIIEDLVSETISNPFIESSRKEVIIDEMKKLYFKDHLFNVFEDIENNKLNKFLYEKDIVKRTQINSDIIDTVTNDLRDLESKKNDIEQKMNKYSRTSENLSTSAMFAIVITLLGSLITILSSIVGDLKIEEILMMFTSDNLSQNDMSLILSFILSFIAVGISMVFTRFIRKK